MKLSDSVKAYDKGKKNFDRYTIIIGDAVYVMSSNPLSMQGFNQYVASTDEITTKHIGKKVSISKLPEDVKIAIKSRMELLI